MSKKQVTAIPNLSKGDEARFLAKVQKSDGCWVWAGSTNANGHGRFKIGGTVFYAHRIAYAVRHGDPGKGTVSQSCGNSSCVRPDHLVLDSADTVDTASVDTAKVRKPYDDFPLFPHQTGRWAKKVRGKLHYFGSTADDPSGQVALTLWLAQKDALLAGRKPRSSDGMTVKDVLNRFLTDKRKLVDSGEITERTWIEYRWTTDFINKHLDVERPVSDLGPDDFQELRAEGSKRWGPVRLGNEIQRIRMVFKHNEETHGPVQFGKQFKKPSAKVLRLARAERGPRDFTAEQLKAVLAVATPTMKAMTLLSINGGFGNTDLATLKTKVVDLDSGWLNYPRPKTGVQRRIPLWPETVQALRECLATRREPKNKAHADLMFISPRRHSYFRDGRTYGLTAEFGRTLKLAGVEDHTFYDLRRTFQTVAEGSHDAVAVSAIMGHTARTNDMAAVYRQRVDDSRLLAVTQYMRKWLFGNQ